MYVNANTHIDVYIFTPYIYISTHVYTSRLKPFTHPAIPMCVCGDKRVPFPNPAHPLCRSPNQSAPQHCSPLISPHEPVLPASRAPLLTYFTYLSSVRELTCLPTVYTHTYVLSGLRTQRHGGDTRFTSVRSPSQQAKWPTRHSPTRT